MADPFETPPADLDRLHDVLADLDHPAKREYSRAELEAAWKRLPRDIRADAYKWGSNDTCVGDEMYVFFRDERVAHEQA